MDIPSHGRLRRTEASLYLKEKFGVTVAPQTLARLAVNGGGPVMQYDGRLPLYHIDDLDRWAEARLSKRVASTSERAAAQ